MKKIKGLMLELLHPEIHRVCFAWIANRGHIYWHPLAAGAEK
jgi:hypothetical protein